MIRTWLARRMAQYSRSNEGVLVMTRAVILALLALLVAPQAEARGGGGGGGGFHASGVHGALRGFARVPFRPVARRAAQNIRQQRFNRQFNQGFNPGWGGFWPADWGDWGGGYTYQPPEPPPPPPPQIIVIHSDGNGRTTMADAADPSYVPGCHAITNGYHCDIH